MANKDLAMLERRLDNWEDAHQRQWMHGEDASTFISGQADKIVDGQLKAANRIVVSQERIESGIDNAVFGIERVHEGLTSLGSAFEWGLSELVWQIEQQREVLKDILEVLQAPLDTKAKELKKRAENAYKNGWFDDALEDFLESEKKNRYDFTIHISLGNIYFFEKRDPGTALEYYKKAVKYATPESPYHASYALLHIGLIKYLQTDFQKACEATSKAIELSPNLYEAHFQHAQYCANLGKYDEAIEHLEKAISGDRYYCVKAEAEKDFDVMKKQLRSHFEKLLNIAQSWSKGEIEIAQELVKDAESYGVSTAKKLEMAKRKLSEAEALLKRGCLFDCWDSVPKAFVAQEMATASSIEYLSGLKKENDKQEGRNAKKIKEMRHKGSNTVGYVSCLLSCLIIYACYFSYTTILDFILFSWGAILGSLLISGVLSQISYSLLALYYRRKEVALLNQVKANENKLNRDLLEVQSIRDQLGLGDCATKYLKEAKNREDTEQYENFVMKRYDVTRTKGES